MSLNIVIPYYKITFFEETLKSIASQTDKRFKVFIGDDDSPEDPFTLLSSFENSFDFLYHRFDKNLGSISLVSHWDRCIGLCDNDSNWIMILGDDDVLGTRVVEEFYKKITLIDNLKINVIKFSSVVIDQINQEITETFKNKELSKSTDAFYSKLTDKSRSSLSEHIFRKSVYEEFGFKDYGLAWHSDDMALLKFSNFGKLFCINSERVFVRVSDKSISGTNENSVEKLMGSLFFYDDLVQNYLHKFSFNQRNLILRIYESKLTFVEEKSGSNYFRILFLYAKSGYLFSIIRFTFRFFFKHKKI
jgi:hypothetical protein